MSTAGETMIRLERTVSMGTFPVYQLTIFGDGKVVYVGKQFVEVQGEQTTRVSKQAVNSLLEEFNQSAFFLLEEEYGTLLSDAPGAILTLIQEGRQKTVKHDLSYEEAPGELTKLENMVDEVANVKRWTG